MIYVEQYDDDYFQWSLWQSYRDRDELEDNLPHVADLRVIYGMTNIRIIEDITDTYFTTGVL